MRHKRFYEGGKTVFLCDKFTTTGTRKNTTMDWNCVACQDCPTLKLKPRGKGKNGKQ